MIRVGVIIDIRHGLKKEATLVSSGVFLQNRVGFLLVVWSVLKKPHTRCGNAEFWTKIGVLLKTLILIFFPFFFSHQNPHHPLQLVVLGKVLPLVSNCKNYCATGGWRRARRGPWKRKKCLKTCFTIIIEKSMNTAQRQNLWRWFNAINYKLIKLIKLFAFHF